eukprot:SAG31_NODE_585_length_13845_cov_25.623163_6_plen_88_part_00
MSDCGFVAESQWQDMMDINAKGMFLCTKFAVNQFRKQVRERHVSPRIAPEIVRTSVNLDGGCLRLIRMGVDQMRSAAALSISLRNME